MGVPYHISDPKDWEEHAACSGTGTRTEYRDGVMQKFRCSCDGGSVRRQFAPTLKADNVDSIKPIGPPRSAGEKQQAYERGLEKAGELRPTLLQAIGLPQVLSSQQKYNASYVIENGDLASEPTYEQLQRIRADWAGVVQPTDNLMKLLDLYKRACWDVSQNKGQF